MPSHHDLFLAVFITNISEFDFSMSDKVLGTHKARSPRCDHFEMLETLETLASPYGLIGRAVLE